MLGKGTEKSVPFFFDIYYNTLYKKQSKRFLYTASERRRGGGLLTERAERGKLPIVDSWEDK